MAATFVVNSSNGTLVANLKTGKVLKAVSTYHADEDGQFLKTIDRIDLAEWKKKYPDETLEEDDDLDILDVGYSYGDKYESPAHDWRAEFRQPQKKEPPPPQPKGTYEDVRYELYRKWGNKIPLEQMLSREQWSRFSIYHTPAEMAASIAKSNGLQLVAVEVSPEMTRAASKRKARKTKRTQRKSDPGIRGGK